MDGTNIDTVWTWNAIGKRKGAWALKDDAPEFTQGFLLNHLISDMLPKEQDGYHYTNSDPVTGQASWFDLRVKVTKCTDDVDEVYPMYSKAGPGSTQDIKVLSYTGGKK
jgi:carbonic anhydrase